MELAAESGPQAVTMAALARRAQAPSGSVYHRFPDRPALLAALWLRTVRAFQEGFRSAVTHPDPRQATVAGARHVITWSRAHPAHTSVLLYGPVAFGLPEWAPAARQALAEVNDGIGDRLAELAARLRADGIAAADPDVLWIALVDLPYATVRRYLTVSKPIPPHSADLVERAVRALLGLPHPRPDQEPRQQPDTAADRRRQAGAASGT